MMGDHDVRALHRKWLNEGDRVAYGRWLAELDLRRPGRTRLENARRRLTFLRITTSTAGTIRESMREEDRLRRFIARQEEQAEALVKEK